MDKLESIENPYLTIAARHRISLPVGHPVVHCPVDGTVGMMEGKIDTTFGKWDVECPLCGLKIYVGKYAVTMARAYHKRQKLNPPSERIIE